MLTFTFLTCFSYVMSGPLVYHYCEVFFNYFLGNFWRCSIWQLWHSPNSTSSFHHCRSSWSKTAKISGTSKRFRKILTQVFMLLLSFSSLICSIFDFLNAILVQTSIFATKLYSYPIPPQFERPNHLILCIVCAKREKSE